MVQLASEAKMQRVDWQLDMDIQQLEMLNNDKEMMEELIEECVGRQNKLAPTIDAKG